MAVENPKDGSRRPVPEVIIAGMGPVGMTLALDLGQRGVEVLVLERELATTDNPRCNATSARSMEYFRRLGLSGEIRRAGLPSDHRTDVVYVTSLGGHELTRFPLPSSRAILEGQQTEYAGWATPEPPQRISQIFLEPILESALGQLPTVQVRRGVRVESAANHGDHVEVDVADVGTGAKASLRATYLVGCDGGASMVRKAIGAQLTGDDQVAERRVSVYFRSDDVAPLLGETPGWMYWWYGETLRGALLRIDGTGRYLCHGRVPEGMNPMDVDAEQVLLAAIGRPIDHEDISVIRWDSRRLVADRFRLGRILLAGDAAHVWLPSGGFGMNTGIGDAMGLSWRLAALLEGWAGERILDDYAVERRSVGEATSKAAMTINDDMDGVGRDPEIGADTERGRQLRAEAADLIQEHDRKQWHSQGIQFGARYVGGGGIAPAGPPPAGESAIRSLGGYEPSVTPGDRLPHAWCADGSAVFDHLGTWWTVLRVGGQAPPVDALKAAADAIGLPLAVLDLPDADMAKTYDRSLVLCRPDMYVAWSGDAAPEDCGVLFDSLLGRPSLAERKVNPLRSASKKPV